MGLIPTLLSLLLLVGYLDVAVAMAGELECNGPYKGRTLTSKELATILRDHQAWLRTGPEFSIKVSDPDFQERVKKGPLNLDLIPQTGRANLCQANLRGADLRGASLRALST
jgi:hypothetical protein